ncbi:MAG: oxidative damage protection protein [Gammaproteobacteria bacterium]|nr:oxidative damage protection protein [Gammaproteobacteria bacterium]
MSRTVHCRKYHRDLPGLAAPPMPGKAGQDLFEHVSAKAWGEWQALQTMLINEHHLSLVDPSARKFLREQMGKFLAGEDYERPAGYVPPE